jgi:hypothetical protein
MNKGWVILHRKIFTSNDFYNELDRSVFIYLLCQASYEPTSVVYRMKRISLHRGELLITHGDLAKRFGLSIQNIRTIIKRLKLTGSLTVTLTRGLMRIRVVKYIQYQDVKIKKTASLTGSLTNRRNKLNKLNNTSIGKTNYDNIYSMKKVTIDKSSIGHLKDLNTAIKPKEKVMSEFEYAQKHLDKEDLAEYTRLALQESGKS